MSVLFIRIERCSRAYTKRVPLIIDACLHVLGSLMAMILQK